MTNAEWEERMKVGSKRRVVGVARDDGRPFHRQTSLCKLDASAIGLTIELSKNESYRKCGSMVISARMGWMSSCALSEIDTGA